VKNDHSVCTVTDYLKKRLKLFLFRRCYDIVYFLIVHCSICRLSPTEVLSIGFCLGHFENYVDDDDNDNDDTWFLKTVTPNS